MSVFDTLLAQANDWVSRAGTQLESRPADWSDAVPTIGPANTGTTPPPGTDPGALAPWAANTAYAVGARVSSYGMIYNATKAGTSGKVAPSVPGNISNDGTVSWAFEGYDASYQQESDPNAYDPNANTGGDTPPGGGGGGGGEEEGGGGAYEEDPFAESDESMEQGAPEEGAFDEGAAEAALMDEGGSFEDPFADQGGLSFDEGNYGQGGSFDEGGFYDQGFSEGGFYEEGAPLAEEGFTLDEDLAVTPESEEDPFAEDNLLTEEDVDLLGANFQWWYLFKPWDISDDVKKQNEEEEIKKSEEAAKAYATQQALNDEEQAKKAAQPKPMTPAQRKKIEAAQRRLAAALATNINRGTYQDMATYEMSPSATLGERLAATKQFLAEQRGETMAGEGEVKGLDLEEMADIVIDAWTEDITDEPADPFRRPASLHHGAAYLEERAYPRGGASSGQEGGLIFPRETLHLNGADDMKSIHVFGAQEGGDSYDCGSEILGAGVAPKKVPASRLNFRLQTTPGGNKVVTMRPNRLTKLGPLGKGAATPKGREAKHKRSIANAKDVAKRAVSVGKKLAVAAKKTPQAAVRQVAKQAKAAGVRLTGEELIGAVKRALSPSALANLRAGATKGKVAPGRKGARRLTPAQMKKLSAITVKAGQGLAKHVSKYAGQFEAGQKRERAGASAFAKKLTRIKGTDEVLGTSEEAAALMYGAVEDMLGQEIAVESSFEEIFGDVSYSAPQPIGTPASPPAGTPGLDPSLSATPYEDPYALDSGGADPLASMLNESAAGPMPTLEDAERSFAEASQQGPSTPTQTYYTVLPEGAVVYDGSRIMNRNAKLLGSWTSFFGSPKEGFVYQGDNGGGHWNGMWAGWYGGLSDWGADSNGIEYVDRSDSAFKILEKTPGVQTEVRKGPIKVHDGYRVMGQVPAAVLSRVSNQVGWGPLIGNPEDPDFKNLYFFDDGAEGKWFWFWNQAPDWAKAPILQVELAKMINDWKTEVTAEKMNAAAQAIQDQLDADEAAAQAKQIAAEDAAMARQAEIDQKQLDRDAEVQARADEAAARQQQIADESEARRQAAQVESEIKVEQALAEQERAAQAQEYEQGERAFQVQSQADVEAAMAEAEYVERAQEQGYADPLPIFDRGPAAPEPEDGLTPEMLFDESDLAAPSFDTGEFNLEDEG